MTYWLETHEPYLYVLGQPYEPKVSLAASQEERSLSLRIDAQVCDGTTERVTSYHVTVTERREHYPYCANGEE